MDPVDGGISKEDRVYPVSRSTYTDNPLEYGLPYLSGFDFSNNPSAVGSDPLGQGNGAVHVVYERRGRGRADTPPPDGEPSFW